MVNIPSNVDWDLFRKFVTAAKYKSFSKASKEEKLQKSALLFQMKRLEKAMGVDIFNKKEDSLINSLTPIGQDLFNKIQKVEAFLNNDKDDAFIEQSNELLIYTTEGIAKTILPKIIEKFHHMDPSINILVMKQHYYKQIGNDEITIRNNFANQPGLEKIEISSVRMGFYASQAYVGVNGNPKSLDEADQHKFVYNYGSRFENFFRTSTKIIEPSITSSSVDFIFDMTARGIGIAEFPTNYPGVDKLVRVLEDEKSDTHTIYAAYVKNQDISPPMQKFITFLRGLTAFND